jgi:hypothetical protein
VRFWRERADDEDKARTAPALRRHVIGHLNSGHRIGRISRRFPMRWLMPVAERMLAALMCRSSRRNLRVSCHLDRCRGVIVAISRAGFVVRTERRRRCRLGGVCNRSQFSRIFCHDCGSTRRSHVGGYNEQSCYRPPARTPPIGTDRSRPPRVARFVRGHSARASWLL